METSNCVAADGSICAVLAVSYLMIANTAAVMSDRNTWHNTEFEQSISEYSAKFALLFGVDVLIRAGQSR